MPQIRNLLFDLGNVIIDIDIPGAREQLLSMIHPDADPVEAELALSALVRAYEVNAISTEAFLDGILRNAKPGVHRQDVVTAWNSMIVGIPAYRLTMLEQLKSQYTVVGLSNTNTLHIARVHEYLQQMHDVALFEKEYFHAMYYSHEIHVRKPDAEAFHIVTKDALITPANTLFVDDLRENLRAACRLGFNVLHSPPESEIAEVLKLQGYY